MKVDDKVIGVDRPKTVDRIDDRAAVRLRPGGEEHDGANEQRDGQAQSARHL